MQKLIELLNEYDGKNHYRDYDEEYLTSEGFYEENGDLEIISKKFGFIKWLVENDKIEFREDFYLEDHHGGGFGEDEDIIMLLSIQDEPIEFLVSILK